MRLRVLLLSATLVAVSHAATLADLDAATGDNACLIVGDKKFCIDSAVLVGGSFTTSQVGVTTGQFNGDYGIQFNGPMFTTVGGAFDLLIQYSVETTNLLPLIKDIGQVFQPSGGAGSVATITETAYSAGFGNTQVAYSQLSLNLPLTDTQDPPAEDVGVQAIPDFLVFNPPLQKIFIVKDIFFLAGQGTVAGTSFLRQTVSQVPEPSFMGIMGLALGGLLVVRRRFKKA